MMPAPARQRSARSAEQGFVLVAVLWLLAALALLVTIFSVYLSNSARALALNGSALQTEALVSSGVELAAYRLQLATEDARPAQGSFHVRLNGADLAMSFVTEAARVDLNAAPKELLAGLLAVLGASDDDARQAAERIVAWRTKPAADDGGREEALYRAAGRTYSPRQAPFAHVNELALVLGMAPALVERALPFVTVFSSAPGVDARVAAPQVVASLPGMTPLILKQFLDDRASLGDDATAIAAALGGASTGGTAQKSQAYRLRAQIRFANGRETASEVVISLRGKDDSPYRVLSWQDDVPRRRPGQPEF